MTLAETKKAVLREMRIDFLKKNRLYALLDDKESLEKNKQFYIKAVEKIESENFLN